MLANNAGKCTGSAVLTDVVRAHLLAQRILKLRADVRDDELYLHNASPRVVTKCPPAGQKSKLVASDVCEPARTTSCWFVGSIKYVSAVVASHLQSSHWAVSAVSGRSKGSSPTSNPHRGPDQRLALQCHMHETRCRPGQSVPLAGASGPSNGDEATQTSVNRCQMPGIKDRDVPSASDDAAAINVSITKADVTLWLAITTRWLRLHSRGYRSSTTIRCGKKVWHCQPGNRILFSLLCWL